MPKVLRKEIKRATCNNCRLMDVLGLGKAVVITGFELNAALATKAEFVVSSAALINVICPS
jgi:hypothetical protein